MSLIHKGEAPRCTSESLQLHDPTPRVRELNDGKAFIIEASTAVCIDITYRSFGMIRIERRGDRLVVECACEKPDADVLVLDRGTVGSPEIYKREGRAQSINSCENDSTEETAAAAATTPEE